ncbi:MAG: alpha/beta hydrolase [Oscillospiraceae bacterium]|nr:alpha/beta hydrolase [Oscillospiraceae bacterium]
MAEKKVKVYRYVQKPAKPERRAVSILLKALLVILAVILVAAAGFWFKCRVMDGRSFMAGFVDLFLTLQHRSDKFTYAEEADRYVEQMRQTNSEPVVIEKARFSVSLREDSLEALQAFIYNDQEHPAQTVFYFHGGGYVNQPNAQQLTMAARTAAETGCEVVLIVYPKMPVYDCEYAYGLCTRFYLDYVNENDCGKVVFMGDSAGGGLALGLAEALRDGNERMPEELILISPWVDLTMTNPDMTGYTAHDPMLGIDGARRMGEIWAGDLALDDPRVSPLYGDLSGLPPVTLTAGTWEVFYPDEALLNEGLVKAGNSCRFIVGEKMIHCYPIIPVPEAKPAQAEIWEAITR